MMLFMNSGGKLKVIEEKPFKLEKDLQTLVENNLEQLMGLYVIQSEFVIKNKRFDTLAWDNQSKSFVIIEYKRDKSSSVVDQGMTYLNLLLEYQGDCILAARDNPKIPRFEKKDIDWSQTRVIFVAASFNDFQKKATNFKDLGIELWEVKQFRDGHILINQIRRDDNAPSIKTVQPTALKATASVRNTIKSYTEDSLVEYGSPEMQELYNKYKTNLTDLIPGIIPHATQNYLNFRLGTNIITDVEIQKKQLKIRINAKWGTLDDPKHLFKNVSNVGHWGNGDYETVISNDEHLEYIMSVVKQTNKH